MLDLCSGQREDGRGISRPHTHAHTPTTRDSPPYPLVQAQSMYIHTHTNAIRVHTGIWTSIGPLMYHWADGSGDDRYGECYQPAWAGVCVCVCVCVLVCVRDFHVDMWCVGVNVGIIDLKWMFTLFNFYNAHKYSFHQQKSAFRCTSPNTKIIPEKNKNTIQHTQTHTHTHTHTH